LSPKIHIFVALFAIGCWIAANNTLPEAVPQHALFRDADDTSRNFGTRKLMQSKKSMKSISVRRCFGASAASLAALLSGTAVAADKELLDVLLKNGAISEEQHGALNKKGGDLGESDLLEILKKNGAITKDQYSNLSKKEAAKKASVEQNHVAQDPTKVETKGKLEWGTADGNFTWRLGGRLHLDGTFYDNDKNTEEKSGVDARRARIELQGTLYKNWMWKLDYEFGQTESVKQGFRDAYIRYIMKDMIPGFPTTITVGQFKEYFGLEHANSSNHMPFVERALVSRVFHDFAEASDGRRIGVGLQTSGNDLWTAALGVFGKNVSGESFDEYSDPIAVEGRATLSPIHTDSAAVHLGFAGNWIDLDNPDAARFSQRPEARIGATRFIDTGVIADAQNVNRWGMEAGGIYGPVWLQSEYLRVDVHRRGADTVSFDGWHTDVGWVMTGESRGYDWHNGVFLNPKPHANFSLGGDGWGALEVAARYSVLDLNNQDIRGGRETNFTAGLHWFPNPNFAFKADWTQVLDITGGQYDGATPSEFLLRAQAYW
jgi:phosphate-selective porin OprO/OprP